MSGESKRDDDTDDDFLDDFVIEDLAGKNDDLDGLFDANAAHPAAPKAGGPKAGADDEDDLLFKPTDTGSGGATFDRGPEFAEAGKSTWSGEGLELGADEKRAAAEKLSKELADDDFALDSEQDLELVGGGSSRPEQNVGASESEESAPFVLDDGEGRWQDKEAQDAAAEGEAAEDVQVDLPLGVSATGDETIEPGWEPLPAGHVDQLSEVGEVERAEGEGGEYAEEEVVDAAAVEGHDLYVENQEGELVGAQPERRGRVLRLFASLAASLTVLAAGAAVVVRPDWFGLGNEPESVQQVEVRRPAVAVPVPPPDSLVNEPPPVAVEPPPVVVEPPPVVVEPPPVVVEPPPVAVEPPPVAVEPALPKTSDQPPQTGGGETGTTPVPVPSPTGGWPATETFSGPTPVDPNAPRNTTPNLVRVSEDLMIGEDVGVAQRNGASGIMPGSRAFAQLHNGNFFIGSVKSASAERITLRLDKGEITLMVDAIAKLTELGSADYDDLQRVTSGFIRLTNNNRLVGGILSGIADDHVVLEFRKNRVMLPKSLVGEVVQGEGQSGIRLDTTREEDDWLRRLAERQIGTGTGASPAPAPAPGAGSPR